MSQGPEVAARADDVVVRAAIRTLRTMPIAAPARVRTVPRFLLTARRLEWAVMHSPSSGRACRGDGILPVTAVAPQHVSALIPLVCRFRLVDVSAHTPA